MELLQKISKRQQKGKLAFWYNWKDISPEPGTYVYVRDLDAPDILEIGWAMGVAGNIKVAVVNDPEMNEFTFDEWQLVLMPVQ